MRGRDDEKGGEIRQQPNSVQGELQRWRNRQCRGEMLSKMVDGLELGDDYGG